MPADLRRTPKLTRQRIYNVAAIRGFEVSVHMAIKDGVDGFRVFRRFEVSGDQKAEAQAS